MSSVKEVKNNVDVDEEMNKDLLLRQSIENDLLNLRLINIFNYILKKQKQTKQYKLLN